MKDIYGEEIHPGDIIMYPVRQSSSLWMTCAVVKKVGTRTKWGSDEKYVFIEKACSKFIVYYSEEEIPEDLKYLKFEKTDSHKHSDFIDGEYITYSPPVPYSFWSTQQPYWKVCNFHSGSRAIILSERQIDHFIFMQEDEKMILRRRFGDMKTYKERRQKWSK